MIYTLLVLLKLNDISFEVSMSTTCCCSLNDIRETLKEVKKIHTGNVKNYFCNAKVTNSYFIIMLYSFPEKAKFLASKYSRELTLVGCITHSRNHGETQHLSNLELGVLQCNCLLYQVHK